MPPEPGDNVVFANNRSLENLHPPRGLTICNQNMFTDKVDLAVLEESPAVHAANVKFVELTLAVGVSVTFPYLLQGISLLCSSLRGI